MHTLTHIFSDNDWLDLWFAPFQGTWTRQDTLTVERVCKRGKVWVAFQAFVSGANENICYGTVLHSEKWVFLWLNVIFVCGCELEWEFINFFHFAMQFTVVLHTPVCMYTWDLGLQWHMKMCHGVHEWMGLLQIFCPWWLM